MSEQGFEYTVTVRHRTVITETWTIRMAERLDPDTAVEDLESIVLYGRRTDAVLSAEHTTEDDDDNDPSQSELTEVIDETDGTDLLG